MKTRLQFGLATLLFAMHGIASGAESLEDAWGAALETDFVLSAAKARVEAAEAQRRGARAQRYPTLSASARVTHYRDTPAFDFGAAGLPLTLPLFDGSSMAMADLRLTAPLYTGGAISAGLRAADAQLETQQGALARTTQDVRLRVAILYIDVLRALSAVDVAVTNTASGLAHLDDVESMFRSGAVARNDLLAASVALADTQQRELQARNQLDLARAAYNRALARPLDESVELEPDLPGVDPRLEGEPLDALTEMAYTYREELDATQSAAEAYRARAEATRARTRPQIALSGGYTNLQNQFLDREDFWTVGLGVRWSALDGGRTRAAAVALERESAALGDERRNLESQIALDVRQAWLLLQQSVARTAVAARALEQADENERVVRDRYRNGEGTNTEVLDAQGLRSLSRANYDSARFDAALSRYRLARAVGLLRTSQ